MLEPTTKTIDTTIGEITVRAMKRKEQKLVFAAQIKADSAEDAKKLDILNDAYDKVLAACVTDMPKKKSLDDLEVGEYENLLKTIKDLSVNAEKN